MTNAQRHRCLAIHFALAAVVIASAGCGAGDPVSNERQVRRGLEAIQGIPQDGFTLGRGDAPWTLIIMSAPTSYELDNLITQLPAVVERFVRGGRLRLQMRTPTGGPYGGTGEERAVAGALLAAGLQGRYWDALVRFVPTYVGGVGTDDLADLLRQSGVADVDRAMTERSSTRVRAALDRADAAAAEANGMGHPVYVLVARGARSDLTPQADVGQLANRIEETVINTP